MPILYKIFYDDLIFPSWQLYEVGIIYPHGLHKIIQLVSSAMGIETQVNLISGPRL